MRLGRVGTSWSVLEQKRNKKMSIFNGCVGLAMLRESCQVVELRNHDGALTYE